MSTFAPAAGHGLNADRSECRPPKMAICGRNANPNDTANYRLAVWHGCQYSRSAFRPFDIPTRTGQTHWWTCWTQSKQTVQGPSNTLYTPVLNSPPSIHILEYTGDAHWATLQAGPTTDCGLSYQPLAPTVTAKERKGYTCCSYQPLVCVIFSDRTVQLLLFWDRISNCTNLFWPEPNQTQDICIC